MATTDERPCPALVSRLKALVENMSIASLPRTLRLVIFVWTLELEALSSSQRLQHQSDYERAVVALSKLRQYAETERDSKARRTQLYELVSDVQQSMETLGLGSDIASLLNETKVDEDEAYSVWTTVTRIIARLYLGPNLNLHYKRAGAKIKMLEDLGVTHIVRVHQKKLPAAYPPFIRDSVDIVCDDKHFAVALRDRFEEVADFIHDARAEGGAVYVHCEMGISRSATAVIAYLMQKHELSYKEALKLVSATRPCIQPNDGFVSHLLELESQLIAKASTQLDDGTSMALAAAAVDGSVENAARAAAL